MLLRVDADEAKSNVENRLKLIQRQSYSIFYLYLVIEMILLKRLKRRMRITRRLKMKLLLNLNIIYRWSNCNRKWLCYKSLTCLLKSNYLFVSIYYLIYIQFHMNERHSFRCYDEWSFISQNHSYWRFEVCTQSLIDNITVLGRHRFLTEL